MSGSDTDASAQKATASLPQGRPPAAPQPDATAACITEPQLSVDHSAMSDSDEEAEQQREDAEHRKKQEQLRRRQQRRMKQVLAWGHWEGGPKGVHADVARALDARAAARAKLANGGRAVRKSANASGMLQPRPPWPHGKAGAPGVGASGAKQQVSDDLSSESKQLRPGASRQQRNVPKQPLTLQAPLSLDASVFDESVAERVQLLRTKVQLMAKAK